MAYIIDLLSAEEEAELKRRGWTVELAPNVDFDTGHLCTFPTECGWCGSIKACSRLWTVPIGTKALQKTS